MLFDVCETRLIQEIAYVWARDWLVGQCLLHTLPPVKQSRINRRSVVGAGLVINLKMLKLALTGL